MLKVHSFMVKSYGVGGLLHYTVSYLGQDIDIGRGRPRSLTIKVSLTTTRDFSLICCDHEDQEHRPYCWDRLLLYLRTLYTALLWYPKAKQGQDFRFVCFHFYPFPVLYSLD